MSSSTSFPAVTDASFPYLRFYPRFLLFPHISHPRPQTKVALYYLSRYNPAFIFHPLCVLSPPSAAIAMWAALHFFDHSLGLAAFLCDLVIPLCRTYSRIKAARVANLLPVLPWAFFLLTHFRVLSTPSPLSSSTSSLAC